MDLGHGGRSDGLVVQVDLLEAVSELRGQDLPDALGPDGVCVALERRQRRGEGRRESPRPGRQHLPELHERDAGGVQRTHQGARRTGGASPRPLPPQGADGVHAHDGRHLQVADDPTRPRDEGQHRTRRVRHGARRQHELEDDQGGQDGDEGPSESERDDEAQDADVHGERPRGVDDPGGLQGGVDDRDGHDDEDETDGEGPHGTDGRTEHPTGDVLRPEGDHEAEACRDESGVGCHWGPGVMTYSGDRCERPPGSVVRSTKSGGTRPLFCT